MKKAKIAFWLILLGFLGMLAYQNWDFFMSRHGLRIDLVVAEYQTPELQNIILFLIFFFTGLLISYFFTLFERFKSKKTVKSLNASLELSQKMLDELKSEIQQLKGEPPPPENPSTPQHQDKTKDPDA